MLAKSITVTFSNSLTTILALACGGLVGDDDHVLAADSASRDRFVACEELLQRLNLVGAGDEPDDAAGVIQGRAGERHPRRALGRAGAGDTAVGRPEGGVAGGEGR